MNRWLDALGDTRTATSGAPAPTIEAYRNTLFKMPFTIYDQSDEFYFVFQINHNWNFGSLELHAHTIPMAAGAGDVILSGYYAWSQYAGPALPALASWTPFYVTVPLVAGDQYIQKYVDLATVAPPATPKYSDILCVFMTRPGATDAADTYHTAKDHGTAKANLGILAVDVHYKTKELGSIPEHS